VDKVSDFKPKDDTIVLPNSLLAEIGIKTGLISASFLTLGTQARDADDYLIYDSVTGKLFYDTDGNGPEAQIQIGLLGLNLGLTNADILVQ
jgi:Ca2+-binding RTX toxin-like protein